MKDLRRLQEAGSYPQVLFLFRDSVDCGERFFAKQWPQARAISDASGDWWKTFSVKPVGSLSKLIGPGVFLAAIRSMFKGNFVAMPGKAPLTEPGLFVFDEAGDVLKQHVFDHIGDHPDFAQFARLSGK